MTISPLSPSLNLQSLLPLLNLLILRMILLLALLEKQINQTRTHTGSHPQRYHLNIILFIIIEVMTPPGDLDARSATQQLCDLRQVNFSESHLPLL